MFDIKDLESLKTQIGEDNSQSIEEVNLIFLDLSSSCTGYSLATINFSRKTANFFKAGCLWFDSSWDNQEKYYYLFRSICNYFYIIDGIDFCVAEAYMINTKKLMGSQVGPELHGALQVALSEVGLSYKTILCQSWRSLLGIKPIITVNSKGKKEKDYKTPTKDYINSLVSIPDKIQSNITKIERATPSDLYDAVAIGIGFLNKIGITKISFNNISIQPEILI